jgi:hypothetical protein
MVLVLSGLVPGLEESNSKGVSRVILLTDIMTDHVPSPT